MLRNLNVWTIITLLLVSFSSYMVLNDTTFEIPTIEINNLENWDAIIIFQYLCVIVAFLGTVFTSGVFAYLIFKGNKLDSDLIKKRAFQMLPIIIASLIFIILGKFFAAEIVQFFNF